MTLIYEIERNDIPIYIGKTIQNINSRFSSHKDKRNNCRIHIIDEVDENEWRFWESFYIDLYKSWGFKLENKNNGGGGRGRGWISSKERNDKIKNSLKNHNKYYTKDIRDKISRNGKGIKKPFSKEHKNNMGIAKRKQAKCVIQYDLNLNLIREWDSKGLAANFIKDQTGKNSNITSQIKDCIKGRQKTAFGYIWRYK